jgi:hypothetical protein
VKNAGSEYGGGSYAQVHLPWQVRSPDLSLDIQPIAGHHTRMRIPPGLAYVDVDYYEQLLQVKGTAWLHGEATEIDGAGKLDFNWNKW